MPTYDTDPATPVSETSRRRTLRDALVVVFLAALVLLLLAGPNVRSSGERMDPGLRRTAVLAVGHPAGWVADQLPFADANKRLKSWLSPDGELEEDGGSAPVPASGSGAIGPEAFDPARLGQPASKPRALRTVLVTGDSMTQPMDAELARRLSDREGVRTVRDPHIGTGISKPEIVDWTKLARQQVRKESPDAVVMWLGANEGFPLPTEAGKVECCSPEWAAAYATRARGMADTYRRAGAARLYWLTVPMPRDPDRQKIAKTVNEAVRVALAPYRAQVRVLEMTDVFTPGGTWRDAMEIGGTRQIVRDPDGIHLNVEGAKLAADLVLRAVARDFTT